MSTPAGRHPTPPQPSAAPTSEPAEHEWAAGLRAGDETAFEAVFRAYYPRLCEFAKGYLRSQEVAEDVVQELFLRLWRQHERVEITGSVQGYLFRAVRNASINRLRRQHVEHRWQESETMQPLRLVSSPDERVSETELARAIARAVDELPERCRLIFTLNRYHGLTYDQIAASLALSRKTIETQMGRAIRALRTKLRDHLSP